MAVSEHSKKVISKAADKIEEVGWWNGRTDNDRGGTICAALAISNQKPYYDSTYSVLRELAVELGWDPDDTSLKPYYTYVTDWNDEQPDGETVINKLREIAK